MFYLTKLVNIHSKYVRIYEKMYHTKKVFKNNISKSYIGTKYQSKKKLFYYN